MPDPRTRSASVTPESNTTKSCRRASMQLRQTLEARKAGLQLQLLERSRTHHKLREANTSTNYVGYENECLEVARMRIESMLLHPLLDLSIVLLVLLNAVAVIVRTPNPPDSYVRSDTEKAFDFVDLATNMCFVLELMLRIFAWTPIKFWTKWMNVFDFIVVAVCAVDYFVNLGGAFAAFRSLRLLVMLNNISFFETTTKSLKAILGALAYNLRFIGNVLILFLILFAIFAQFGIENFHLSLSRRCVTVDGGKVTLPPRFCSGDPSKGFDCGDPALHVCNVNFGPPNHDSTNTFAPGSGFTSFDNFGEAFLILYQITTMSTWFEYVYALKDSEYTIALFYPISVFVLISMVSASLFVAVITHGFAQFREAQKIEEDLRIRELTLDRKLAELTAFEESHDPVTWSDMMQNKNALIDDAENTWKMVHELPDNLIPVQHFTPKKENELQEQAHSEQLPKQATLEQADVDVEQADVDVEQANVELLPEQAPPEQLPKHALSPKKHAMRSKSPNELCRTNTGTLPGALEDSSDGGSDSSRKNELSRTLSGTGTPSGALEEGSDSGSRSLGAGSGSGSGCAEGEEIRASNSSAAKVSTSSEGAADLDAAEKYGKPAEYWDTTDSDDSDNDSDEDMVDSDSWWDNCFPKRGDEKPKVCFRLVLYNFVKHGYFDLSIMVIILVNVACLATIYDGMTDFHFRALDISEYIFTSIFTVEALIKIIGLGPYPYFRRRGNLFDFVLVAVSLVGLFLQNATVSVLRMFRLVRTLRLIRVLRKSKSIRRILDSATHSMTMVLNVFFLLFLVFLCYGLVGLAMFGNRFNYHYADGSECLWNFDRAGCAASTDYDPRNFDTIYRSLNTLFVVTTLDGWEDVMYTAMATSDTNKYLAPVYFISFTIITAFLILNLLVAAILDNLQVSEALDAENVEEAEDFADMDLAAKLTVMLTGTSENNPALPTSPEPSKSSVSFPCLRKWCQRVIQQTVTIPYPTFKLANIGTHTSCQLVKQGLVWGYRKTVVVLVVLSMVVLAFDTKHKSKNVEIFIHGVDIAMIVVLTLEMVIKVLANGWLQKVPLVEPLKAATVIPSEGETTLTFEEQQEQQHLDNRMMHRYNTEPYWTVGWNRLDLFILCCCVLDEILYRSTWSKAKLVFRSSRALKVISSLEGLQKVAQTLISAIGLLIQICILCFMLFLVFAILGVSLFVGKFKFCNDFTMVNGENLIQSRAECLGNTYATSFGDHVLVPRVWGKYDQTFDNVFTALATLFDITSLDAWSVVMYNAVNLIDDDLQPFPGSSRSNSLFFLFFVFMSSMFVLQMFVAVVVDSFYHVHGFFNRTNAQSQMRNLALLLEMNRPQELPQPPMITDGMNPCYAKWQSFRKFVVYDTVLLAGESSPNYKRALVYDYFVTGMLWINIGVLLTQHFPSSDNFHEFYETQSAIFLGWYWIEVLLKLVAVGFSQYITDAWNWLDTIVVLGSSMQYWTNYDKSARALRVLRIFKLMPQLPQVQALLKCMLRCFWNVSSVLLVLFLFYYMFGIAGMQLFVDTKYGMELNENTNFKTFGNSLLTLLRVSTGEYIWLLRDCSVSSPKCVVGSDCGSRFAWAFFSMFLTFTSYITFQLFLAVVIDSFAWAYSLEDSGNVAHSISADHVQQFIKVFNKYDILHSGLVSLDDLVHIVNDLPEPLGKKEPSALWMRVLRHELRHMPLRINNKVSCTNLFMVLAVKVYGKDVITDDTVHDADARAAMTTMVHFNKPLKTLKASMQATADLGKVGRMLRTFKQIDKDSTNNNLATSEKADVGLATSEKADVGLATSEKADDEPKQISGK